MHDPEDRLDRLNANERQALRLLGEGHTAKSIAALTGKTESAIHERLREARRKTGVGSSRELARLLRTRENRDGQFGMAAPPATVALRPASVAPWWRWRPEVIVMMLMLLAGAALLTNQAATPNVEPLSAAWKVAVGVTPQQRQGLMMQEPRDSDWADRAEPVLRARFAHSPKLASQPQVTCRSLTCMVSGTLDSSVSGMSFGTLINGFDLKSVEAATALRADSWALSDDGSRKTFTMFFHRGG